jgi:diguanylate cyclase (GGDEF)-like protein/PAS domain S-box-containing protein
LTLESGHEMRSLAGHLALLRDPTGRLTIDEVRQRPASDFIPLETNLSLGSVEGAAWLRFELARAAGAPADWWLHVRPRYLDHIDGYTPDGHNPEVYRRHSLDPARPWTDPFDPGHAGIIPLRLSSADLRTYFLRIANATDLQAQVDLWQPLAFVHWLRVESLLQGGFLITALIIVLINLYYWSKLREPIFSAYAGYVATFALQMLILEGTALLVLQPGIPLPLKPIQLSIQVGLVWFSYRIFATIVKPERAWPRPARIWRQANLAAVIGGALLVLAVEFKLAATLLWSWLLLMLIVNLACAGLLLCRRDLSGGYYILIIAVLLLGAAARLLYGFGVIEEYGFLVDHGLLIGTLVHWVVIQVVLADMLSRAKREHEQARDLALEVARRGEGELERLVTEKTQAIAALAQRHEALLMAVGEGISGVDAQGRTTFINPAAQAALGYTAAEVLGKNQHDLFHYRYRDGRPYPPGECPIQRTLQDGLPRFQEEWLIRRDGSPLPVAMNCTPLYEGERLTGAVVAFRDISEQKAREVELLAMANTDMLTGIANRRYFFQRLQEEIQRLGRAGRREARSAVLLMDLDHFKQVNDTYGHAAGDEALRHFAQIARQSLRQSDLLGRLGGEEFAALLTAEDAAGALRVAERLRRNLKHKPIPTGAGTIGLTLSIGVTELQAQDQDAQSSLKRADDALYAAKERGRNRVCVYESLPRIRA